MADSPVTPIALGSDTDADPEAGFTNPTLLERGASERAAPATPAAFPERIGHYKVVREIGAGGMGHVLKCLDTTLNRYVALKVLRPALARNAAFIERFRREAHAVAKLRHPNIVQIYAIGQEDGHDFFTMEYVDGEGLDRVLGRRTRLPEREALEIGLAVCRGLHAAHEAGILHRDIKPGNVLVNSDGRAQLGDFGLAKFEFQQTLRTSQAAADAGARSGDASATDPGRVMGTPFYMAPELIQGRDADARTDVYAVGVMLYELLTGHVPFRDTDVDKIFDKHLNELPRPIAETNPEVSLETATLIYRALDKDPKTRFRDAEALAGALQQALDRERRARELQTQAKLSAEMATAFGSMRMGSAGGQRTATIITRVILVAMLIGFLYLVMEGLETKTVAGPVVGTPQGDREFAVGSTVRVAGIVNAVTIDGDRYTIALYGPAGERNVRIPIADWRRAIGAEPPAEDTWWAAEGQVQAGPAGAAMLPIADDRIWAVGAIEFFDLKTDSDQLNLIEYQRVPDPTDDMLGRRAAVRGTVVWRDERGSEGEVTLLLVRGGATPIALRVVIPAEHRPPLRELQRCRVGESIHAIGRLKLLPAVENPDPVLTPTYELQVVRGSEVFGLKPKR